jgi:hypothetical protein
MVHKSSIVTELGVYYVNLYGKELGPFPGNQLRDIPGFTLAAFIRSVDSDQWQPAYRVLDLKAYFSQPSAFRVPRSRAQAIPVAKPFIWDAEHIRPRFRRVSKAQIRWLVLGFLLIYPSRLTRQEDTRYEERLDLAGILQPFLSLTKSYAASVRRQIERPFEKPDVPVTP